MDGYEFAREVSGIVDNDFYLLYRVTNGVRTGLGGVENTLETTYPYLNLRRNGNAVEGWASPDGVNWTLVFSAQDSTHATGTFFPSIHITGASTTTLDDFGAASGTPPAGELPIEQTFGTGEGGIGVHCRSGSDTVAEPVNTRTGAFTSNVDDLATPGTGVSFDWGRTYTSADPTVGRLGPGWTDSVSASLAVQGNGDVLLHGEDGQQALYTSSGGSFLPPAGCESVLSAIAGGYKLVRTDQVEYLFDTQGRLTSQKDRNNQGLTFAYDGQGRLASITDAASRQYTLAYNASNLVSQVSTPDGRSVSYGYTSGRLTSVTDVRGKVWTYTYDAAGWNAPAFVDT